MTRELLPEVPQDEADYYNAAKAELREACARLWAEFYATAGERLRQVCAELMEPVCFECARTGKCADPLACPNHPPVSLQGQVVGRARPAEDRRGDEFVRAFLALVCVGSACRGALGQGAPAGIARMGPGRAGWRGRSPGVLRLGGAWQGLCHSCRG